MAPQATAATAAAAATLAAKIAALDADQDSVTQRDAKEIYRRAQRLGRCDLLPLWLRNLATAQAPCETPVPATERTEIDRILMSKAGEHAISLSVLRICFQRGLREYTEMTPRPACVTAAQFAHARVNTFIRLVYSDPDARADDADLLTRVHPL